jgi:hypothetical protein
VLERCGRNAVALYIGNPSVHSLSATVLVPMLARALGTQNYYTAASVDQIPKHVSSGLMFGRAELIRVAATAESLAARSGSQRPTNRSAADWADAPHGRCHGRSRHRDGHRSTRGA